MAGSGKAPKPIPFWQKSGWGKCREEVGTEARRHDSDDCLCSLQTLNTFWLSDGKTEWTSVTFIPLVAMTSVFVLYTE